MHAKVGLLLNEVLRDTSTPISIKEGELNGYYKDEVQLHEFRNEVAKGRSLPHESLE